MPPQIGQSFAESKIWAERGNDSCTPCSGPPRPNRYFPRKIAIQLSMIVVITSCAPTLAFRIPAIPPQIAPARIAARMREQDVQRARHSLEVRPDQQRRDQPDPELSLAADVEEPAAEGERDGDRGQDQRRRHEERLLEVAGRLGSGLAGDPREEPVEPGALEDRPVRRPGLLPVIATTRPPIRNARTVAAIGVTMPPRRVLNQPPTTSPNDDGALVAIRRPPPAPRRSSRSRAPARRRRASTRRRSAPS